MGYLLLESPWDYITQGLWDFGFIGIGGLAYLGLDLYVIVRFT